MMPFYKKYILKRSEWISFADILFIIISYSVSYTLVYHVAPAAVEQLNFGLTLMIVLPVQLATLWFTGLYREKIDQFCIANALHITASIGSAVGLTGIVFLLMESLSLLEAAWFLIFNFYFLLMLLFGHRIGYQALSFWFDRDKSTGKNVLIYGAGEHGVLILQSILSAYQKEHKVIGFLDDDPSLEGKLINGYPVFGSHWVLSKIYQKHNIDFIFLSDENIGCENLKRLRNIASQKNISIKKLNITLQEIGNTDIEEVSTQVESNDSVRSL